MHKIMTLKKIKVFFKFIICTSNNRVELEQASKKHSRENEKNFKGEMKFHTVNNKYVCDELFIITISNCWMRVQSKALVL